jgi:hypothetical protein
MRLMSRLLGSVALLCITMFSAEAAMRDRANALDWQTYQVPEYGTHVEYPAKLFAPVGEAEKGIGRRFEREDGRAVLSIYARENEDDDTPASYLRKNLRQPLLDYERVTRSFFAISMERDGTIFYRRCNFSACHTLFRLGVSTKRGNTHKSLLIGVGAWIFGDSSTASVRASPPASQMDAARS